MIEDFLIHMIPIVGGVIVFLTFILFIVSGCISLGLNCFEGCKYLPKGFCSFYKEIKYLKGVRRFFVIIFLLINLYPLFGSNYGYIEMGQYTYTILLKDNLFNEPLIYLQDSIVSNLILIAIYFVLEFFVIWCINGFKKEEITNKSIQD